MNLLLVMPLLAVVAGLAVSWFVPVLTSPATAVRVLTAAAVTAGGAVASALVLVLLASLAGVDELGSLFGWCRAIYAGEAGASPWVGALAAIALIGAGGGARRSLRRRRRELAPFAHVDGVHVTQSDRPVAFAVPGRPGGVVIAASLLGALDPLERRAVLAHEQAHLDGRHHRYVGAVEVIAGAFPFLGPIARKVRYSAERSADEVAATHLGSRTAVARAIAKVALLGSSAPDAALAVGGCDTAARVEALVHPRLPVAPSLPLLASVTALLATLTGASVQVHHLAVFVLSACQP